ncbi:MAG: hypothetical protein IJX44_04815 [Bacteroidaceae bacterium]|nr:hypothetical protein [Bacteroidaceae bacterium]
MRTLAPNGRNGGRREVKIQVFRSPIAIRPEENGYRTPDGWLSVDDSDGYLSADK